MLSALVKDLADVPGIEVTAARDHRLPIPDLPARFVVPPRDGNPWEFWERCMDDADAVWPIAPETDGALERLSRLTLDRGKALLGSSPDAVRLTASKLDTSRHLEQSGVPAIPTCPADKPAPYPDAGSWVLKPDDGAGCEETIRLANPEAASRHVPAGSPRRFVIQPFIPGVSASLSLLCRDGEALLLSCNRQAVSLDGDVFRYSGGSVGGLEAKRDMFEPIAAAVAKAIPGLWGYVGVDVIDGPDGPVVLEVNPRLTTSYVGLGEAIGQNPAALVMELLSCPLDILRGAGPVRPVIIDLGVGHD